MSELISKKREAQSYRWYRDTKMIGTLILLSAVTMQVFAWIHVPFFTTIHAYTVGMLFGNLNPLFYFYAGYYGVTMILDKKIEYPTWAKTTRVSYWFVVLSIIFVSVSFTDYYNSTTVWGTEAFGAFETWFYEFTNDHNASGTTWLIPHSTLGGLIGVTMHSFVATIFSGIGAIIIAVLLLITSASILITGTTLGLYKEILKRNKVVTQAELEKETTTFEVESITITKEIDIQEDEAELIIREADIPFDDPFGGE